jgi:hypothetical protein
MLYCSSGIQRFHPHGLSAQYTRNPNPVYFKYEVKAEARNKYRIYHTDLNKYSGEESTYS